MNPSSSIARLCLDELDPPGQTRAGSACRIASQIEPVLYRVNETQRFVQPILGPMRTTDNSMQSRTGGQDRALSY